MDDCGHTCLENDAVRCQQRVYGHPQGGFVRHAMTYQYKSSAITTFRVGGVLFLSKLLQNRNFCPERIKAVENSRVERKFSNLRDVFLLSEMSLVFQRLHGSAVIL